MEPVAQWPYFPTLLRLTLALAVGLFVGIERERRRKEAGLRTFGLVALLGGVGGLIGGPLAWLSLALIGVLVVLLNVETIRTGEGAELTTSAALLIVGFAGMLAGEGHTFTPTALGVATAALLAWKEPLAGFSHTLTEAELRSAVLLAILTFVVYPVLPHDSIDPWSLIQPREAWLTVILIAALGFVNYVLLKRYGMRGIEFTGFLGGLVNSTVTVTELSSRARTELALVPLLYRGVVLATSAMLLRNAIILAILSPPALWAAALPFGVMVLGATLMTQVRRAPLAGDGVEAVLSTLKSPFSLAAALRFGAVFLVLQLGATLAQRAFGHVGFYVVSLIGGLVSSASAVASAAALSASGVLPPRVAGLGAVLAAGVSALVSIPLVARIAREGTLVRRVTTALLLLVAAGAAAEMVQLAL